MTLSAVLFDMDGLLVNTEPIWLEVEHETLAALGGTWSEADQQAIMGASMASSSLDAWGVAGRPTASSNFAPCDGMPKQMAGRAGHARTMSVPRALAAFCARRTSMSCRNF